MTAWGGLAHGGWKITYQACGLPRQPQLNQLLRHGRHRVWKADAALSFDDIVSTINYLLLNPYSVGTLRALIHLILPTTPGDRVSYLPSSH